MHISGIMTTNTVTVHEETPVVAAVKIMLEHNISGLPVLNSSGQLVGMLTEGDLLRRSELGTEQARHGLAAFFTSQTMRAHDYLQSHARYVRDVMTSDPITIGTKDTLADAVDLMLRHKVKRLPVIRQGRLVGIISRKDILKAYAHEVAGESSLSDVEISRKLMIEMTAQPWAPREMVSFLVTNGVVEFNGMLTNDRLRDALRVMAEAIPGVRGVKDHMAFVDPVSGIVVDAPIL